MWTFAYSTGCVPPMVLRRSLLKRRGTVLLSLLLAGWAIAVAGGLAALWDYSSRPAPLAARPASWPADSGLPEPTEEGQLVAFFHPRCPCSRASVAELAEILAATPNPPPSVAVFFAPPNCAAAWWRTDLWDSAAAIPGVTCVVDVGGTEANRFGATASGTVALFDENGQRTFIGGVTPGRGHRGDCPGNLALTTHFAGNGQRLAAATAPAYGCGLRLSSANRGRVE